MLMGDFNIDTLSEILNNPKPTHYFINIFSSYYYHKLINHPTWERNHLASLIDNIYTNMPDCYDTCKSGVLKFVSQSDHYSIFTTRNIIKTTKPKTHITKINHRIKTFLYIKCVLDRKIGHNYMEWTILIHHSHFFSYTI